ncbi:hypothetical protein [Paenibacillus sp. R14(2021)]|uniref:hypothetical protein n=1 Tax=Paenibacillus sp. R14(2021) TaxID=2859228 RepID=UPI001C612C82|nr:hypothetical protein [Paenibacillus sp. R14(2021)]
MGILGRLKGWLQAAEEPNRTTEPSFETYLESAGERLREFAVIISKLESELLTVRDRVRGQERQLVRLRGEAEAAAARQDAGAARSHLEREFEGRSQLAVMIQQAESMEASLLQTKQRFASFKQAVDEAGAKRDMLLLRKLHASAELEASKLISGQQAEGGLEQLRQEALEAESRAELARAASSDAIDEEIEKLLRSKQQ